MKNKWATGLKTGVYLAFIALLLSLLLVDAPWEETGPATGGSTDAPFIVSPAQDQVFHDTNVTLEWEGVQYRYQAEIFTNSTQRNSSLGGLQVQGDTGRYPVSGLPHGIHEYRILGVDSAGNERVLDDRVLWLGFPGVDEVRNTSDGSIISPAQPAWAPLFWQAQPDTTYAVTINTHPFQVMELNITIDNARGYARVENLEPGKVYSYQVDQVDPQPATSYPITGDVALFQGVSSPSLEFQLRGYTYILEIADSNDPTFTSPLVTYHDLEATTLALAEQEKDLLELGEGYHWRVRATDGVDHTTDWSAVGTFRTGTTDHLGQELLETWGATVMILGGVLLATMVGGIYLAKDEEQELILPEYSAEDVLTATVPTGPPEPNDEEVDP